MSIDTAISWTDHTGGPFLGCTKVSEGCKNCYAAELANSKSPVSFGRIIRKAYKAAGFDDWETRPVWGDNAPRVLTKSFWTDAVKLNTQNAKAGVRTRWFPSLIDWLDDMPAGIIEQAGYSLDVDTVRASFLDLIRRTPHIDWLLLTKRPQNFNRQIVSAKQQIECTTATVDLIAWLGAWLDGTPPANIWLGATVENQEMADLRIPALLEIPARLRFLSCEPLLGPIDLNRSIDLAWKKSDGGGTMTCDFKSNLQRYQDNGTFGGKLGGLWVICGGESGSKARAMHPDWARSLRDQCATARIPFHFKQHGCFREATSEDFDNPRAKLGWVQTDGETHGDQHPRQGTDELMILQSAEKNGRHLDGKLHDAFPSLPSLSC